MRGVKKATAKGHVYYYHRKTGIRITEPFGSAAFVKRVEELNADAPTKARPAHGTLGALFAAYQASPEFTGLADLTKRDYRKMIDGLSALSGLQTKDIDAAFLIQVRDKAFAKHGWRFANYTVDVLRIAFKWGKPRNHCKTNPALDVPHLRRPREMPKRNRAWSDAEVRAVLDASRGGVRVAVALGAFAGMRLGDARRLLWSARQGGWLTWTQSKTGDAVSVPELRDLTAVLDAADKTSVHMVARSRKRPIASKQDGDYTDDGFRASFMRVVKRLQAEGKIGLGLTFHGLRATAATNLANAGCDADMIASITGHRSNSMVRKYTEGADKRRRAKASIEKLERQTNAERKTKG